MNELKGVSWIFTYDCGVLLHRDSSGIVIYGYFKVILNTCFEDIMPKVFYLKGLSGGRYRT